MRVTAMDRPGYGVFRPNFHRAECIRRKHPQFDCRRCNDGEKKNPSHPQYILIYAVLLQPPPFCHSDPGPHSGHSSPLRTTVQAFFFIASGVNVVQHFLPSSIHAKLSVHTATENQRFLQSIFATAVGLRWLPGTATHGQMLR